LFFNFQSKVKPCETTLSPPKISEAVKLSAIFVLYVRRFAE